MTQHQAGWHFCIKCSNMQFNNGAPGVCLGVGPGDHGAGDHKSQGFNFGLPFDRGETAVHEPRFFFCSKCHSMFKQQDFGSGDDLGPCAKGGQHDRTDSINFVLSHDTPVVNGQDKWFVCVNCHALFFGRAANQKCSAHDTLSHDPGQGTFPDYNLPHGDADA